MLLLDDVIGYYVKFYQKDDVMPSLDDIRATEYCHYRIHKLLKQMKKKRRAMMRARAQPSSHQSKER
jgi:hypothetical protein